MLGVPLRYLLKHPLAAADLAVDPLDVVTRARDIYIAQREQRGPACQYVPDFDWERRFHEQIGASWPCSVASQFSDLWTQVIEEMKGHGIQPGPESFGSWNDGDAGLVRAIWCVVRHLQPARAVETGVAHGVTSRFILEAMQKNGRGHLWSIDVPPLEKFLQRQVAVAVGDRYPERWSYIKGSSRRRLPGLLSALYPIELFVHDSLHSERNVRFELEQAWQALTPEGVLVVDDIDSNWGFKVFTNTLPAPQVIVCEAEPLRPDGRRFNRKGLFGIIVKRATARSEWLTKCG